MNDLELDTETHDLVIENGDLKLLNDEPKVVRQTLTINLLFFQGEWFLDLEYGVPYFQSILVKGATKDLVDSLLRRAILDSYRVETIERFQTSIRDDAYFLDFLEATTSEGNIISITNQSLT